MIMKRVIWIKMTKMLIADADSGLVRFPNPLALGSESENLTKSRDVFFANFFVLICVLLSEFF